MKSDEGTLELSSKPNLYLSPDEQFRWMYIYPSWTKSKNIHWSIIVSRKVISTPTESRFFKIQKKRNRYNECSFKYFWIEGSRNGIAFLCPRDECHFLLFYMLHGKMAIRRLFVYVNTNKFSFTFLKSFHSAHYVPLSVSYFSIPTR